MTRITWWGMHVRIHTCKKMVLNWGTGIRDVHSKLSFPHQGVETGMANGAKAGERAGATTNGSPSSRLGPRPLKKECHPTPCPSPPSVHKEDAR